MLYFILIKQWSATDWSYMREHTNGWTSDDDKLYVFDSWFDYQTMLSYFRKEKWK